MATSKTNSARRREVRRNIPRRYQAWALWVRQREVVVASLFAITFSVVGSLIAISAAKRPKVQMGQIMPQAVVARVEFRAIDQEKTLERKTDARVREPSVYVPNPAYLSQIQENLNALVGLGADASIKSIDQIPAETRRSLQLTAKALEELRGFIKDGKPDEQWVMLTGQFIRDLWYIAVLDTQQAEIERRSKAHRIVIQHPNPGDDEEKELERYYKTLISVSDEPTTLRNRVIPLVNKFPPSLRNSIVWLVTQDPQPTYLLSVDQTNSRRQAKFDQEPPVEMTYQPGDVLVPAGKLVEHLDLQVLQEERASYRAQLGPVGAWLSLSGRIGLMTVLAITLWIYIVASKPRITGNAMRGVAMTTLLLLCQVLAMVGTGLGPKYVHATGTFPTLLAVIILAIAYDQRFALAVGLIHTLIVMVSLDLSLGFGLVILAGLALAGSLLNDVRNRSTLVRVGLWSGVAMATVTLLVGFASRPLYLPDELQRIFLDACLALGSGFGTGLVVQGFLPAIEQLFHVTTSMTLRELNDASHPVLRRLAQEAPGTYQHSLQIADMAETAADAVGANGLLCKVGAMYHDIGKINKPKYFVENQGGGPNRHNKLSPAMSLLIIVGHVKDGMEMAREYNLPRALRQFVESHHGTTLVEYFYHAAKQKREAEDKPAPTEFEFRYPGPKPQTKEAAILMLCDSVESAARTLDDPTSTRIEQLVHTMANKRLMDGQFDECNITLQELHKIEQSLVKTLCAIHHTRVKYPTDRPQAAATQGPEAQAAS